MFLGQLQTFIEFCRVRISFVCNKWAWRGHAKTAECTFECVLHCKSQVCHFKCFSYLEYKWCSKTYISLVNQQYFVIVKKGSKATCYQGILFYQTLSTAACCFELTWERCNVDPSWSCLCKTFRGCDWY